MTTNADRVNNAEVAIQAYLNLLGIDEETVLRDLLTDLMHWVDARGDSSFEGDLASAREHYEAEK